MDSSAAGPPSKSGPEWGYCAALNFICLVVGLLSAWSACLAAQTTYLSEIVLSILPPVFAFALLSIITMIFRSLWLRPGAWLHAIVFPTLFSLIIWLAMSLQKTTPLILLTLKNQHRTDLLWMNPYHLSGVCLAQFALSLFYIGAYRRSRG